MIFISLRSQVNGSENIKMSFFAEMTQSINLENWDISKDGWLDHSMSNWV